jgi:hypothetical protein
MINHPSPRRRAPFTLLTEYIIAWRQLFTFLCTGVAERNTSLQAAGIALAKHQRIAPVSTVTSGFSHDAQYKTGSPLENC